jgi:hypothetical protein
MISMAEGMSAPTRLAGPAEILTVHQIDVSEPMVTRIGLRHCQHPAKENQCTKTRSYGNVTLYSDRSDCRAVALVSPRYRGCDHVACANRWRYSRAIPRAAAAKNGIVHQNPPPRPPSGKSWQKRGISQVPPALGGCICGPGISCQTT